MSDIVLTYIQDHSARIHENGRSHVNTAVTHLLIRQVTQKRSAVVKNGRNANVHVRRRNETGKEENGSQDPGLSETTAIRKTTGRKDASVEAGREMTARNAQEAGT